ncbi:MAG TPA: hypothetical protein PKA06_08160 [Gemmatales bacterium]|nr:hypothetical protein [Gemmatales bacterium]
MSRTLSRLQYREDVPAEEVEAMLHLALLALQSLHGDPQTRFQVALSLNAGKRECLIDDSTPLGSELGCIFLGFLQAAFEPEAIRVDRVISQG